MKDLTNNRRIQNVEYTRDGHQGVTLYYELDGVPSSVSGEFYIDKQGVLHHTVTDPKDETNEIEIMVQYFD